MEQHKKMAGIITLLMIVCASAGCATTTAHKTENEALKTQVASLESQVSDLNQRVEDLSQKRGSRIQTAHLQVDGIAPVLSPRAVQTALKRAGYYEGAVDGKMGKQTVRAIKTFQKAKGLAPDGKVGAKTSVALGKYLSDE